LAKRAGYGDVFIIDPKIAMKCVSGKAMGKVISLRRESGGRAVFELFVVDIVTGPRNWESVEIDTAEKFEKLWNFLLGLAGKGGE